MREVEQLVSGHGPGSRPGDPRDAAARRHVLRFEVSGEVLASVREALSKIRRDAGEPLDDDAALLLMARAVLEGPSDRGRSSYQLALTVCEHCRRGTVQGSGEPVEVEPEVVEMAACDAQQLGRLDQEPRAHAHGRASMRGAAPLPRASPDHPAGHPTATCCDAITGAAWCRAAGTRPTSTCITW